MLKQVSGDTPGRPLDPPEEFPEEKNKEDYCQECNAHLPHMGQVDYCTEHLDGQPLIDYAANLKAELESKERVINGAVETVKNVKKSCRRQLIEAEAYRQREADLLEEKLKGDIKDLKECRDKLVLENSSLNRKIDGGVETVKEQNSLIEALKGTNKELVDMMNRLTADSLGITKKGD